MIRVRQIKVDIIKDNKEEIINQIKNKLNTNDDITINKILKKSIDARDKENIKYIYEIEIKINNEDKYLNNKDVYKMDNDEYIFDITPKNKDKKIIIVGAGPAGLFNAYMLSMYGYKPIIIERGEKIEDRVKTVNTFFETNKLNENSNVQFGEGGAGTFSDGKLNTLTKDKENRMKKVFEIFVKCGAPKEIMYDNKPHIGTDKLRDIIINMRNEIIKMGGSFRYNTTLTDIIMDNNKVKEIIVNNNEKLPCDILVLALGNSARDTFYMLNRKGINIAPKPFAVGIRISHTQKDINKSQYGKYYDVLPPCSYKLTYKTKNNRSVYSFCMCPGGYVVNSSSEKNKLVINGMSNYKRNTINANSALVVSVDENDYGHNLFDGVKFQEMLEQKAYKIGNGLIPTQKYIDFKNNKASTSLGKVEPIFKGNYELANINEILPKYIAESIIEGIEYFSTKINDYNMDDALVSAVETRTSSPIRILRDENYETNIKCIYPIGEGSGYSGGITTSSMDGIRAFEKIVTSLSKD